MPVHNASSALVYNASGGDVDTVIVDGQVLMRDKRVLCVDEAALLAECQSAAVALAKRAGTFRQSNRRSPSPGERAA